MKIPSKYMEEAVEQLATLPSIGKRSALRLVIHLLNRKPEEIERFAQSFLEMKKHVKYCKSCGNISDLEICAICSNPQRKQDEICVVEDVRDVMAIEETGSFHGIYHVLGGIISPLDGIGPEQLTIEPLIERVSKDKVTELIFALNPNIQGDTTIYYIQKKLNKSNCLITTIARGIAFGGELEYADEMTLGKSISNRQPIHQYIK